MLAKDLDRAVERRVRVEFPWSRHPPHVGILEQTFKLMLADASGAMAARCDE
jgi:hypothetical protein